MQTDYNLISAIPFDVIPNKNQFYDTFYMTSKDTSEIYTDKFLLSVVNLRLKASAFILSCLYMLL